MKNLKEIKDNLSIFCFCLWAIPVGLTCYGWRILTKQEEKD